MSFKKPGELILKTTSINDKKAYLKEFRLCWIKVVLPNIGFQAQENCTNTVLALFTIFAQFFSTFQ